MPDQTAPHDAGAAPPGARVLIASHSHPMVQNGGSEIASHGLFERVRDQPGWAAWYLGCTRGQSYVRPGQSITQPFADDDYLYTVGDFEGFRFANRDTAYPRDLRALLRKLDPQIVHFHHYVNFGMETFFHVRDTLPDAQLVLTLHEFLAICHQQGQMVTRQAGALCHRADPVACTRCFPEAQPADFFLRRLYADRFLAYVDHFVAPSRFLAERYIAWGLPAEKVSVIENVPRPAPHAAADREAGEHAAASLRIGFFGQISELKGISVLLGAAELLEQDGRADIAFAIHGDHTNQQAAFQAEFLERIGKAGSNVAFHGAYANAEVDALMQGIDLVVVPSVWWENSPVVIQEAFRNGRAVVCSDIGGMAEKVTPGETGVHFRVGSARALADALTGLAADPARVAAARTRWDGEAPLDSHLRLYRSLLPASASASASDAVSDLGSVRPAPRFGHG
jgi:glycosyltransferase involved in cell wall biosynthesis